MDKYGYNFKRRIIQLISAVLYNANIKGFLKGEIFQGDIKGVCVPGLNCYSCPAAIGACPLGSLQGALGNIRYKLPFYVVGLILLFGLLLGRVICGFLCPFGLIQELLYKIPTKKLKKNRITKKLSLLKYVLLVVLVVAIPIIYGYPAFCKYICPAGTLEGGIPLVLQNESLQNMVGIIFSWKIAVLMSVVVSAVFVNRSFCRFLCPLGALYSFFNRVSLLGIKINEEKCNNCSRCIRACPMDIKKAGDKECIQCGKCIESCNEKAIEWKRYNNRKNRSTH